MPSGFEHDIDHKPPELVLEALRLPLMPSGFEHSAVVWIVSVAATETAPYAFGL